MLQTQMETRPFTRLLTQADWYIHIHVQPAQLLSKDINLKADLWQFYHERSFYKQLLLSTLNQILLFCHIICSRKYFLTKNSLVYLR